jgi:hypothetical protein
LKQDRRNEKGPSDTKGEGARMKNAGIVWG